MKILIFGSSGMLGTYLTDMLESKGNKVLSNDFSSGGIDIADRKAVEKLLKENTPNWVINCAAYTDVNGAEENIELARKVNAQGVQYIAEVCKELRIPFIHISTDYVFGENKEYTEDYTNFKPLNAYGKTKLEGEQAIANTMGGLQGSNFNQTEPKMYIVRTSWLFGPNAKNFISKITQNAKELDRLKVVTDEIGCPTYVKDLSQAIYTIMTGSYIPGIYHCCSSNSCSRYEFAEEILRLQNIKTSIDEAKLSDFERKAKVPSTSILLNTKLPTIRTWEEMTKDFLLEYANTI